LVKALEEKGIGRPSTYAAIMTTIQDREYVEKLEGRFHPTGLGTTVNDLLVPVFKTFQPDLHSADGRRLDEYRRRKIIGATRSHFYDKFFD
jgi:DNA topoisomerase-1